jgi:predicted DNA-binding WGR domain protein
MPKRRKLGPNRPAPIQLPLFAEAASLIRVRPALNEWRYYRMEIWPDLFGRALLLRQWGRIGTQGRRRLDPHPDPGAALNALAALARQKRRRGYRDRTGWAGSRAGRWRRRNPVLSPLFQRVKPKATSRTATLAKRSAPKPRVRTPEDPLAPRSSPMTRDLWRGGMDGSGGPRLEI